MDRSSRQGLRSERISNSPYKRPEASGLKKSSSTTFSTVKNIFSYALSPLFRSSSSADLTLPTTNSDIKEIDQKSESGSEDGWNGSPPALDNGKEGINGSMDVFDLAAAAGRHGKEFEDRAAKWRAKGEVVGGRRDLARRSLTGIAPAAGSSSATPSSNDITLVEPNGLGSLSSTQKRPYPSAVSTPIRPANGSSIIPTPSFLPPASTPGHANSASSAALAAFLEAKKGSTMTAEDLRVIDSLTHNLHVEAGSPQRSSDVRYGGWSAGMSPRVTKSMPARDEPTTPARSAFASPFNTPGSTFSVGSAASPSIGKASPYRVRYLGPGMSPKRMLGKQRSGTGMKPLFQFEPSTEESEESATKKRKVEDQVIDTNIAPSLEARPLSSLSQTVSMPDLVSVTNSPARNDKPKSKVESRPHPLSQSTVPSQESQPDHVIKGKKRAADIMRELIEEQLAPVEAAKATGALTSDIVINPYDFQAAKPLLPADKRVYDSPRKSVLRASVRDSPKRGAAAKLELSKSVNGKPSPVKQPAPSKVAQKQSNVQTPTTEKDQAEIDELMDSDEESVRDQTPEPAAPARQPKEIKEPEPFKAYEVPVLDTPSRPLPSFSSPSASKTNREAAPSFSFSATKEDIPAPKFTPSAPKPLTHVEDEIVSVTTTKPSEVSQKGKYDPTKIWMSAKDTVLAIAKPALPFFTFDPVVTTRKDDEKSKSAKQAALKAAVPTFTFTLPTAPTALTSFKAPTISSSSTSDKWKCSLCMCTSPDSAQKCVVCEEPRPNNAPAKMSEPAAKPFQWPSGSAPQQSKAEWGCPTCMCKSPLSAAKCVVCDEARPATVTASSDSINKTVNPAPTPFKWPGGAPKAADDQWTCSICMLKSPQSAAKCVVCETPKP